MELYCILPRAWPSYLVASSDFSSLFLSFTFDSTNRAVPIEEYKDNLKAMVTHVRQVHPESKVLLMAPPTIHEVDVSYYFVRNGCSILTFITANALRVLSWPRHAVHAYYPTHDEGARPVEGNFKEGRGEASTAGEKELQSGEVRRRSSVGK